MVRPSPGWNYRKTFSAHLEKERQILKTKTPKLIELRGFGFRSPAMTGFGSQAVVRQNRLSGCQTDLLQVASGACAPFGTPLAPPLRTFGAGSVTWQPVAAAGRGRESTHPKKQNPRSIERYGGFLF